MRPVCLDGHGTARTLGDRDARDVLERLVRDETRHAELSWRIAGWLVAHAGPAVRSAFFDAAEHAIAASLAAGVDVDGWHAHGRERPRRTSGKFRRSGKAGTPDAKLISLSSNRRRGERRKSYSHSLGAASLARRPEFRRLSLACGVLALRRGTNERRPSRSA
jgi:hypothetical protein